MSKFLFYYSDHNANAVRQTENEYGGVGYYRIIKVAEQMKSLGEDVTIWGNQLVKKGETAEERWARVFKNYDVFWTSYFSDGKEASALFYTRDKFNAEGHSKRVVLDVDDNFIDILDSHPLYDRLKPGKRDKAFMSTILTLADVLTVSTEPLKQRLQKHFKDVYKLEKEIVVIPNMNDSNDWNHPLAKKHTNKIVIGYTGSNSHQDDIAMFLPQLHKVMKRHKNVYFESIGSISKEMLYLFKDWEHSEMARCDLLPATWTFKEYPKMLAQTKWDIGVAPLVDSSFTRCKSHIKFMEYSSIKVPVIASRVYPYYVAIADRDVIEHEKTGLLVKPTEWEQALEDLIRDKQKRIDLAERAHLHVKENWQYSNGLLAERLKVVIEKLK